MKKTAPKQATETHNVTVTLKLSAEAMKVVRAMQRAQPGLALDEIMKTAPDDAIAMRPTTRNLFVGILQSCAKRAGREWSL
jgi:hypothetical protein